MKKLWDYVEKETRDMKNDVGVELCKECFFTTKTKLSEIRELFDRCSIRELQWLHDEFFSMPDDEYYVEKNLGENFFYYSDFLEAQAQTEMVYALWKNTTPKKKRFF